MGYFSRSGNYVSDPINEQYNFNNGMTDGDFSNLYTTIHRYEYIKATGLANGQPFYVGVAKTMEALHFSTLVDVYGNVPYTQAFDPEKYQQPKYDDAATIYTSLISGLDSAITYFEAAKTYYKTAPSTAVTTDDQYDLIYGRGAGVAPTTRMNEWEAFANTIKLKLLLHEYKVATSAYINTEIGKINANGAGYIGAGESAAVNPGYSNVVNKQNPFYAEFYTTTATNGDQTYLRANTYAVNFYENTGDERESFFYGAPYTSGGLPTGNYDGDPAAQTNSVVSQISGDGDQSLFGVTLANTGTLKSSAQDQLILSDFESLFIQAEAAERGWAVTGTAADLYRKAVEQNFVYLNANLFVGQGYIDPTKGAGTNGPVGEADYYLLGSTNPNPDPNFGVGLLTGIQSDKYVLLTGDQTNDLGVILTQKWAALNGINWVEAWTDYRRTGYPTSDVLGISKATTHIKNAIPTRYLYPQSELNTNGANVPSIAAPAQYGLIFWDKN